MTFQLEVLPHGEWAPAVADLWVARLGEKADLNMCLPTGTTPKPVYREMVGHADFSATTVFLLDEFGLAERDPGRCDIRLEETFLSRLESRPEVHSLDPQAADLDAECRRYSMLIAGQGIDLAILGLGVNGHLGLNEPGSEPESKTRVVALAEETIKSLAVHGTTSTTTWGMTVGLAEILGSKEVWLLVSGEHKAQILRRTLIGPMDTDVPASFLRLHQNVVVWVDEAAASHLV